MARRLTYEEVKSRFTDKGWKLISKEYLGNQKPLTAICPNGHETDITLNNFNKKQGCKHCAGNVKYTYEQVEKIFKDENCKLISKEYINNNTHLEYQCSCGNTSKIKLGAFIKGHRCRKCMANTLSVKNKKITDEEFSTFCESKGCKFLGRVGNRGRRIKYQCSCGKETEAEWYNFKRYPNCWECGKKKKSGDKCYMWNPDREQIAVNKLFQKRCYNLLSRTLKETDQQKLDRMHEILGYTPKQLQDHIYSYKDFNILSDWHIDHYFPVKAFMEHKIDDLSIINHLKNLRPLEGAINLSKADKYDEKTFLKWLKYIQVPKGKYTLKEIENDFDNFLNTIDNKNIKAKIIDPTRYEHRTSMYREMVSNLNTNKLPLFILPYEWMEKKEQCKSRILSLAGIFNKRIYARKCEVKEIDIKEHQEFCEKYHIQGKNGLTKVSWGLFYDNELVGSISLGRHHRNYDEVVLDRLCFYPNLQIIGGAEKLFNRCKIWAKVNGLKNITSFSDNRWSIGNVYDKLGFVLDEEFPVDYFYIHRNDIASIYSKQSQKKKAVYCPEGMTEFEWAKMRCLMRVWNCGKKRWLYQN